MSAIITAFQALANLVKKNLPRISPLNIAPQLKALPSSLILPTWEKHSDCLLYLRLA